MQSVGQMGMGIFEEKDDSLNEFVWMIVREIDSSFVKCVTLSACIVLVLK
jgi:hypothetical protein